MIISKTLVSAPGNDAKKIDCPVMNVVGDNSPHIDDSMWFNGRLNPTKSNFVKVNFTFIFPTIFNHKRVLFRSVVFDTRCAIVYILSSLIAVEWFWKKCLKRCLKLFFSFYKDSATVGINNWLIYSRLRNSFKELFRSAKNKKVVG